MHSLVDSSSNVVSRSRDAANIALFMTVDQLPLERHSRSGPVLSVDEFCSSVGRQ